MKTPAVLALVLVLSACGSAHDGAEEFVESCSTAGVASHDFGSSDLGLLARVHAIAATPASAASHAADQVELPLGFTGSTAFATGCESGGTVTFVLEP